MIKLLLFSLTLIFGCSYSPPLALDLAYMSDIAYESGS